MAVIYALVWYFSTHAGASVRRSGGGQGRPTSSTRLNTVWVLITAFLVFFMQAGFMMLEGGFARTREVSNIMIECIVDTAPLRHPLLRVRVRVHVRTRQRVDRVPLLLPAGRAAHLRRRTGIAFMAFLLFQFAFADTASTIVSGAMVGRTAFKGDLLYSVVVSGFIYPIFGHWIWGPNGWLATMDTPFRDFAGSTVVHTIGGVLALCGAIALGPRLGRKFKRDGGGMPPGHNMTLAALGAVILWFGWYGFNPGSTLSAMDFEGIGRVATNTTLAACAGALVAVAWVYPRSKKWDVGISINGLLAGLVAITCPCYWVSPTGSIAIGAIAGVVMVIAVDFTEWFRVDDPCGAFAVHGVCGIWGTMSLGLFAVGNYGLRARRAPTRPAGRSPACSTAATPTSWWPRSRAARRSSSCTAAAGLLRHVRRSRRSACCGSPRRASSRASTSTSTAPRRTTRSRLQGYSPIPSVMVGAGNGGNQPQAYEQVSMSEQKTE